MSCFRKLQKPRFSACWRFHRWSFAWSSFQRVRRTSALRKLDHANDHRRLSRALKRCASAAKTARPLTFVRSRTMLPGDFNWGWPLRPCVLAYWPFCSASHSVWITKNYRGMGKLTSPLTLATRFRLQIAVIDLIEEDRRFGLLNWRRL